MKTQVFISPTTHWDREWVQTQIQFQIRLVSLIDKLMEILEGDPGYSSFFLDGQTAPLEDYMQIKPQMRARLCALIKAGRIIVGPWYVLGDQFLEDAESTVRNLIIGRRQSIELGGKPMNLLYVPDSFGSIDSLPMFAQGFDIPYIMFGRGRPLKLAGGKRCFIWKGPDGSAIPTANHGYGSGLFLVYPDIWTNINLSLPNGPDALRKMLEELPVSMERENTRACYFSAGADHMEPRASLPLIVEYMNARQRDFEFLIAGPQDYMDAVMREHPELVEYSGEMRGPDVKMFNGCTSSHMNLKQANFRAQRWLERYVEPLSTIAAWFSSTYPGEFLEQLWKLLIINHPHDSICGCSIDRVHEDMMNRYERIEDASVVLAERASRSIAMRIQSVFEQESAVALIAFNTLGETRSEYVRQWIRVPRRFEAASYTMVDRDGTAIPCKIKVQAVKNMDLESLPMTVHQLGTVLSKDADPQKPDYDVFTVLDCEAVLPQVPGMGYKVFWILPDERPQTANVTCFMNGMENEFFKLQFNENGTFDLFEKQSGCRFARLHHFEDTEDIGDTYGYHHFEEPDVRSTLGCKAVCVPVEVLPFKVTYRVEIPWSIPETSRKGGRSLETIPHCIRSEVTMYAGIRRIDIRTDFDNHAKNHRFRAVFPTTLKAENVISEGNFSLTTRKVQRPADSMEGYPQQSFSAISDNRAALIMMNRGLPEFEAVRSEAGSTLYLTLLRSVGELGSPAGANHPVPAALALGNHVAEYAIGVFGSPVGPAEYVAMGHSYTVPFWCEGDIQHQGELPSSGSFLGATKGIVVSALKKAERDNDTVVRYWNPEMSEVSISLEFPIPTAGVWRTNLNEDLLEEYKTTDKSGLSFKMEPGKVVTFKVALA